MRSARAGSAARSGAERATPGGRSGAIRQRPESETDRQGRAARARSRETAARAARPERARIREVEREPVTAAERMRSAKAEAKIFGKFMVVIAFGFAAVFALLSFRITAMQLSLQSHKLKVQIEEATQMKENLEAKVAIMASSPKIQRRATDSLGMIPASDVYYIKKRAQVSPQTLARDMKYFDKTARKVRAFRLSLARRALEREEAAAAAKQAEVAGTAGPSSAGQQASSPGAASSAGQAASGSQVALAGGGGAGE